MKVILIRPKRSKRAHEGEGEVLKTKDGSSFPALDVPSAVEVAVHAQRANADVVWIDEPSLFEDEETLPAVIADLRQSSIILVSGLGATSELEPFGQAMPKLLAIADEVNWAKADCDACGGHGAASRTLYIGAGPKEGQVCVGGAESYVPACPECWTRLMKYPAEKRRTQLR